MISTRCIAVNILPVLGKMLLYFSSHASLFYDVSPPIVLELRRFSPRSNNFALRLSALKHDGSLPCLQVALECLSVLKASVSWLSRTLVQGVGRGVVQVDGEKNSTPAAQLKGPGHGSHAARACIASTVPSVIDCFSRIGLRGPAEDVLAACAGAKVSTHITELLYQLQQ